MTSLKYTYISNSADRSSTMKKEKWRRADPRDREEKGGGQINGEDYERKTKGKENEIFF